MKLISIFLVLFVGITAGAGQLQITSNSEVQPKARYSHDFGLVWVNQRAYTNYTVTNTGTTPLSFKDAIIYGGDFSAYHSCNKILMPNDKCSFEITYWPIFEGFHSGQFILSFIEDRIIVDLWGRAQRM